MDGHKDALTDAALEREIESALSVEPSPEFVARVRARVASEPAPIARWFSWRLATSPIVLIVESAAVVFVLVTVLGTSWLPVPDDRTVAPVASKSAPPAPQRAEVVAVPPVVDRRTVNRVERRPAPSARPPLPAVLIADDEKRGFELFLEELRDEKSAAAIAEAATGRSTPGPPWLEIEPVVIVPLSEFGTVEGGGL